MKNIIVWGVIVDLLVGLLWSVGLLGSGQVGLDRKKKLTKYLKERPVRKQLLGTIITHYEASIATGEPMFKDPKFYLAACTALATILPAIQGMLPEGSVGYVVVGGVLVVVAYIIQAFGKETAQVNLEVSRNMVTARRIESDNLTRALSAKGATNVTVSGLDSTL